MQLFPEEKEQAAHQEAKFKREIKSQQSKKEKGDGIWERIRSWEMKSLLGSLQVWLIWLLFQTQVKYVLILTSLSTCPAAYLYYTETEQISSVIKI